MKIDRELLELAATAAGYDVKPHPNRKTLSSLHFVYRGNTWNPLTDDGDALRLACTLGLMVDAHHERVISGNRYYQGHRDWVYSGDSTCGAIPVRRAIVCAAAAIGEGMQ